MVASNINFFFKENKKGSKLKALTQLKELIINREVTWSFFNRASQWTQAH